MKEKERQDEGKGWERKERGGLMWWSQKWLPAVQKVERQKLWILVSFVLLYTQPSITRERDRQRDSERKKRKWRTKRKGAIKQEQESERESREQRERDRESERARWLRRLPASPPFSLVFFPPASSSFSIILPRSIASRHKTELTSTALCNTAPPAPRKCCAPLEQLQSSCTNRNAPMRQASERLVFNPVVQDGKPQSTQQLQRRSYTGRWMDWFYICTQN